MCPKDALFYLEAIRFTLFIAFYAIWNSLVVKLVVKIVQVVVVARFSRTAAFLAVAVRFWKNRRRFSLDAY